MDERKITGALGIVVIIWAVVVGVSTFLEFYLLDVSEGAQPLPTFAVLAIAILFVFALFALGARSDRWLQNPYW